MEELKITNEIVKPEFKEEIVADITGTQKIEDNIKKVQEYAIELSEYYKGITFTEEQIKQAKDEKANINKFKDKVSTFRKEITKQWNEPLKTFTETAKTTETMLEDTYDLINNQIKVYEDKQKQEKEEEVRRYFDELCEKEGITFVKYEQSGINVTLSASMKSLKAQAKDFLDKIAQDIQLIETQENKHEIMVEYEVSLNVSEAIMKVNERIERLKQKQVEEKKIPEDKEMLEKIEQALSAPKEIEEKEEVFEMTFTVKGTKTQLKELKQYLVERGLI